MARLNRAGKKRGRNIDTKSVQPGNYLIVTEGTETEVNYFKNLGAKLNELFHSKIIVEKISLDIHGTARSTKVLVNEAIKKRSLNAYSDVWVVFDRDDNRDFDEAISLAKKEGMNVAWSNESFELWLLLHFQTLQSALSRDGYYPRLDSHFKRLGINNGAYSKNIADIFDITYPYLYIAIKRSKDLIQFHKENKVFNPDNMNPGTTVHTLVEELSSYIK